MILNLTCIKEEIDSDADNFRGFKNENLNEPGVYLTFFT